MSYLRVVQLLLVLAWSGCCCPIEIDLAPPDPEQEPPDDDDDGGRKERKKGKEVDLGNAEYPSGNDAEPVTHPWHARGLDPSSYRVGYKLPDKEAKTILASHHAFSRRVGHRRIDEQRFHWRPPRGCLDSGLRCVYEELDAKNQLSIEPLSRRFRERAEASELNAREVAALVISFVQHIPYEIPTDQPFGVLPPTLVVKHKEGDCDSKSLLAYMILRELGIRSVLVSSEAHAHTMLGVAIPAPGKAFTWRGTKYSFVELTAKSSPIGHIDPKLTRPNDWVVVTSSR